MDKRIRKIWDSDKWSDKCILISEYHMEMRSNTSNKRGERWTLKDTSEKLDLSIGYISESINLAKAIINNSELKNLSREQVLKVIRK